MDIKALRIKLGLSQQELADKTAIPKSRIGQWEIGNGKPKAADTQKLTNFFIEKGVMEPVTYQEYDVASAVKKTEALSEVILSAVAELLAKANNQSSTVVKAQLQDLVNKRLGS